VNWARLALLVILPAIAHADSIPEATRAHLRMLEERLAVMPAGRARDKVAEEVARIRREYKMDGAAVSGAAPGARREPEANRAYQNTQDNWEKRKRDFQSAAEEELRRREGDSRAWQQAKDDFMSAAEAELRRREGAARAYGGKAERQRAYDSNLSFAQKPVRLGGLGYDFAEADRWVKRVMGLQSPAAIAAFRARYAKAVAFAQLPKEEGGLGYVRAYARKVAVEVAEKTSPSAVEDWIAQHRTSRSPRRSAAGTCRSWFSFFSK
jgi:hypothetical protein